MGRFVGIFMSPSRQWVVRSGFFFIAFVLLLLAAAIVGTHRVQADLEHASAAQVEKADAVLHDIDTLFGELAARVDAPACTPGFLQQLRLVAMRPDGINEMIYMPEGRPLCSANFDRFEAGWPLGLPDLVEGNGGTLWLNRPLAALGYPGLVGSVVQRGDFAVVVPVSDEVVSLDWAQAAIAARLSDGTMRRLDLAGANWDYDARGMAAPGTSGWLHAVVCTADRLFCAAQSTTFDRVVAAFGNWIGLGVLGAALAAVWISGVAYRVVQRFFAFEARFLRNFTAERIICTYQPVLDLAADRICGCEVLVRWRDLDDRVVFPDQFLPIVERHGLTMDLTRFVVASAHAELHAHVPEGTRLQVNFNVAPRDLDAAALIAALQCFDLEHGRFRIAVEIVETEAFDCEKAGRAVDALRRAGVACYLDDFGRGFSSLHSVAALGIDGVKVDRSFAMAAETSLLAQMLPEALRMIRNAGRKTVVEGVETAERLAMLRATGLVDYVQGYFIARPLPIERFVQILVEYEGGTASHRPELQRPLAVVRR